MPENTDPLIAEVIEQLRAELRPVFPGPLLDKATNGAVKWRTIRNKRSQGFIPGDAFVRSGSRDVWVVRDRFLLWLATTLRPVSIDTDRLGAAARAVRQAKRGARWNSRAIGTDFDPTTNARDY